MPSSSYSLEDLTIGKLQTTRRISVSATL